MNEISTSHVYTVVAAAFFLSTAVIGCASSNEPTKPDSDEQVSSAPDYDSTDDDSEASSESQANSMKKPSSDNAMPGGAEAGEQTSVSDAELKEFASINRDMKTLQNETRRKMQSAESREEARKIQTEAQERISKVFDDYSMSRTRYKEIGAAIRSNPELQQRYRKLMQDQTSQ